MIASLIRVRMEVNVLMALTLINVGVQLDTVGKIVHLVSITTISLPVFINFGYNSIGFSIDPSQNCFMIL